MKLDVAKINNVFVVNMWGKAFSGFSKGTLNTAFADMSADYFASKGCEVKRTNVWEAYDVDEEIGKYQWADLVVYQSPTNWMGMGWEAKKWADEVWTAGMDGRLCHMDGRHRATPDDGYGSGGSLEGKAYMLSLTFNAPKGAFDRDDQYLFQGKSVDDLWYPFHMNNRFFAIDKVPDSTFVSYDVVKNPTVEEDFNRYKAHLAKLFP